MPTKEALPTSALSDVQDRRSVGDPVAGALTFIIAMAKFTSESCRPSALSLSTTPSPSVSAGPFTPAKAFTWEAPTVSRFTSTVSGVVPSVTVIVSEDFLNANPPST